jgi:hypothetical protein
MVAMAEMPGTFACSMLRRDFSHCSMVKEREVSSCSTTVAGRVREGKVDQVESL